MEYIQDIILACLLVFGLISGFISGGIKKGTRAVLFLVIFFGLYFGLSGLLVDYLRYDLLSAVTQGQGITVSVNSELTIRVMNFEDLFIILQNADEDLTATQLKATCQVFFTVVTFVGILFVSEIASFPLAMIVYHLFVKYIFMVNGKKPKIFSRVIGAILGIVEVGAFTYLYTVSVGQFTCLLDETISIFEEVSIGTAPEVSQLLEVLRTTNKAFNYNNSIILKAIIDTITNSGLDPFSFVSIKVEGSEETITLPKAIQGLHDAAHDSIVKFIDQLLNQNGNGAAPQNSALLA